ncbi:hypothetical protein [Rhizobium sp. Leaf371]|uniref:hypothetical protein n=1 Tax=Rhizobium sp. Leaf371 TaxID=1736355 RepID=UPI000B032244|nr:hypothetical protein [Rhizobium sp. Leaf371]
MSFLTRLFRRSRAIFPVAPWPDGPPPRALSMLADGTNPIHRLLDDWRLPRHETRAQLTARLGPSPGGLSHRDMLALPEAIRLAGAFEPWTADGSDRIPPQFPIGRFSSVVWFEDDAHANLRRIAGDLATKLGPAPTGQHWNTLVAAWRAGTARISLIAWPPELQPSDLAIDAENRDPRLRTACHVHVETGYCLPLSSQERDWVAGFRPIRMAGSVGTERMAKAGTTAAYETELEYVRDPSGLVADRQGTMGLSADGQALIVVSNQLYVIPRASILRLDITRLTRAKGAGGSSLRAICRTQAPGTDGLSIQVAQSCDPDGMTALAEDLGAGLGCPVSIGPYHPDC